MEAPLRILITGGADPIVAAHPEDEDVAQAAGP